MKELLSLLFVVFCIKAFSYVQSAHTTEEHNAAIDRAFLETEALLHPDPKTVVVGMVAGHISQAFTPLELPLGPTLFSTGGRVTTSFVGNVVLGQPVSQAAYPAAVGVIGSGLNVAPLALTALKVGFSTGGLSDLPVARLREISTNSLTR